MTITTGTWVPPPGLFPDQVLWPRLEALRDCLCDAIDDWQMPQPCICAVVPGLQVAIEECNPCGSNRCGMGWVRINSVFPSTVFPVQDVQYTGCNGPLALEVEIGVVRCAPVGDAQGNPPTQEEWEKAAQLQYCDMMAMRQAVRCCYTDELAMLGAYTPIGPEGGCVGGSWAIAVSPQYHTNGRGARTMLSG